MDECKVCANADNEYCFACDNGNHFKPMTNANRIRAMTDEELAKWIAKDLIEPGYDTYDRTYQRWLDWLKSPVEVDE